MITRTSLPAVVLATAAMASFASADMAGMRAPAAASAGGSFQSTYDFFSNYGNYMPRTHCIMRADGTPDWPWIGILLALNLTIIVGYLKIFHFWRQCYLAERPEDRHTKLMDLARIFLLCATCGYGFFILTVFWPGYRLLAVFMAALAFVTWRFAFDLDSFRLSFSAKRLQRELNEHLQIRNDELESLVEQRTRELEQADAFKRQFLSNMSHELRTPMTAVLGFADMISEGGINTADHDDAVHTIQRNGRHMLGLLNDVLDLSKIEAGKLTVQQVECKIDEIVCDVINLLSPKAREQHVVLTAENRTLIPHSVKCDPMRLQQILTNLVGNALKFTTDGTVLVALRFTPNANGSVGNTAAGNASSGNASSGRLEIAVTDSGCGISAEALSRIFEPFEQAGPASRGGTGLGLTISRSLARLLGGDITAVSVPGRGSTFTVSLPVEVLRMETPPAAPIEPKIPASPPGPIVCNGGQRPLTGKRILIAEDAPDAQLLLRHMMRNWGAEQTIVEHGAQALEQIAAAERPFDMFITDMQMPVMDGITVTRQLRSGGSDLPIIMLTANAMAGDRERCMEAGCSAYVAKPVDPGVLLEKVLTVFARSRSAAALATT